MKNIGIIGTGGFAREVLCLIDDLGDYNKVKAFYETDEVWESNWKDKQLNGLPVLPFSDIIASDNLSIGIGDPTIREKVVKWLPSNSKFITLIHPTAVVSRWTNIDIGAIITANTIVTCQIEIGKHCQLNLNTTIGHDCTLGDFFTTAPATNISGTCNFGDRVYFGTGAATRQGINICDDVVIGMGAMVVKHITEPGVYVGIPAKRIK
ncbi:MAG: NeuD/PglB/VioB family sugar acetyltransferase [Saprospiraceae bacterium]